MSKLAIIQENNDYIVVNKQAGLISEKSPFEALTVEAQVFAHLQQKKKNPYVGVIHRLDRVTSGVLMFAKKKTSLSTFNELFRERHVQKTYLAIVTEKPVKDKGILNHFLVKNNLEKRADIVGTKSKEAQSCQLTYQVINQNQWGYLLEVKPKTGRFHQIRAQLAHIGLPILGDEKYGSKQAYLPLSICLHAWKLSYKLPNGEENITHEAPLPENDFWNFTF